MADEGRRPETTTTTKRGVDQLNNHHHYQHQQEQMYMDVQGQHHHHHHMISFRDMMMMQSSSSSSSPFLPPPKPNNYIMGEESGGGGGKSGGGAYDLEELDEQSLFLYLDHHHHHEQVAAANHTVHQQQQQRQDKYGHIGNTTTTVVGHDEIEMKPPTLNIFPSQPMHLHPLHSSSSIPKRSSGSRALEISQSSTPTASRCNTYTAAAASMDVKDDTQLHDHASSSQPSKSKVKREKNHINGSTSSSEHDVPFKTPDHKTLRRLAQNREAARKSRLRKKAYVQQLESSRIRLSQLEQELQRARAQGIIFGADQGQGGLPVGAAAANISTAMFDLEYARWLEEHHRMTCELQAAIQEQLPENELKIYVDNCLAHYDMLINLKTTVIKSDVFHIVSGMWKTPAERCFLWMGGFRPSELIKIIVQQIEALTEQQLVGICQVQRSTQEAEEALSQGLEALNQSLSETIASDSLSYPAPNMNNYMAQMAMAINKLSTLQAFVTQADSLRHQTLHRLCQILTTRQAARCFLAIAEYFHRLRALSSLWLARPRQE